MPKDMFYKIAIEKQKLFLSAAKKEFTTKPYEQASVNSIIKEAKISRGSFYNYFEDLDTLFEFIFTEVQAKRFERAKELILDSNKDVFIFLEKLFRADYEAYTSDGTYTLFRNYIHYIRNSKNKTIKEAIILPLGKTISDSMDITSLFDLTWISVSFEDFIDVIEMAVIIMIDLFITSEQLGYSKEQTMAIFKKRFQILKKGISK